MKTPYPITRQRFATLLTAVLPVLPFAPFAVAQQAGDDLFELSPFYVTGGSGYTSTMTTSASLFAEEIARSPVQIDVLTSEFMEDVGASDINQALMYATNVRPAIDAVAESQQAYKVRGLESNRPTRNYLQVTRVADRYNVERVEVLQGPAALQYGRPDPGGLVNMTGKVPTFSDFGSVQLQYGAWDNQRAAVDVNRHFGRQAVRFNAVWRERDSWRPYEDSALQAATLHYLVLLTPKTILRVEGELGEANSSPSRSVIKYNGRFVEDEVLALTGGPLTIPRRWAQSHSGPDNHIKFDWRTWEVTLQHRAMNDRLNIQLVHNEGLMDRDLLNFINSDVLRPNGTIRAYWNGQVLEENSRYTRLNASYDWDNRFGFVRLIGGLRYDSVINTIENWRDFANLAANTNPNFQIVPLADIIGGTPPRFADTVKDYRQWAVNQQEFEVTGGYLAVHAELFNRRLNIQAGMRYDENRVQTHPNQSLIASQARPNYEIAENGKPTHSMGFVYQLVQGLGLFVNYGESYNITLRRDFEDRFLPARTTRGYDLGFKFNAWNERLTGSVYAFKLDNLNNFEVVPTEFLPEGAAPGGGLSTDDESQGFGIDITANPLTNLTLRGGYGYIDVYRKRGHPEFGVPANQTVQGNARHNMNLFARYNFREGFLRRVSVGGGVNYRSAVVAGYLDSDGDRIPDTAYTTRGYTEFSLLLAYARPIGKLRWNIALNITNLFDTRYMVPASLAHASHSQPRSFLVTSNLRF
jgi:iron complex outermembrane recepter protein